MSRVGTRGGPVPPLDLKLAQEFFEFFQIAEYGWVRAHILRLAAQNGEFHGDMMAAVHLPQPNMIGAAVNALAKWGLLEKLNRAGELEHRASSSPAAHSRASYVWRLTEPRGRAFVDAMPDGVGVVPREFLTPGRAPAAELVPDRYVPLDSDDDLF